MILLLQNVTSEDFCEVGFTIGLSTVVDGRIAEHRARALLHERIELSLVLAEVEAQSGLLLLARLQHGKVDAEVEFFELVLASKLYSIKASRVIAVLLLDLLHSIDAAMYASPRRPNRQFTIAAAISEERISARGVFTIATNVYIIIIIQGRFE